MNRVKRFKNDNYTTISNVFLKDNNLSIKAKGFLAVVMGLPENWDFSIRGICSILQEGKTAVYNVIEELRQKGYCLYEVIRDDRGLVIGTDYSFAEEPAYEKEITLRMKRKKDILNIDNPNSDNQETESREMDNETQLNTKQNKHLKEEKPKDINSPSRKFNFKEALLEMGVSEIVASDWMIVRKDKKGSNTQTAFTAIAKEINNAKADADTCIRIAVERSWCGFKSEWVENILSKEDKANGRIAELQGYIDGQKNEKGEVWSTQLNRWLL